MRSLFVCRHSENTSSGMEDKACVGMVVDLKSKPYLRSDGVRRSQKRQFENGNLVPVGSERV